MCLDGFFTGSRILNAWENKNYSDKKNGGGKNNRGKTTPPLIQVKITCYSRGTCNRQCLFS